MALPGPTPDDNYGDLVDLQIRLGVLAEGDREIVPVFGSGLSNAELPDIVSMTKLFREAVPHAGRRRFDSTIDPIMGTSLGYQNAASLLRNQAGEAAVAQVIRRAVLGACHDAGDAELDELVRDVPRCRRLERDARWRVPEGYRQFARYYASLPGNLRSKPIITTNFDPFIEIALREAGITAEAVPVGMDVAPTVDQLAEKMATPVLHIHGYWLNDATLNTVTQLTKPRPNLQRLLAKTFARSVIVVIGYSGWRDAFMQSLADRVKEADLLNAEILWGAYAPKSAAVLENEMLAELDGLPGFTLYLGIEGHKLFGPAVEEPGEGPDDDPASTSSPFGYTRLPASALPRAEPGVSFADGAQPRWADAEPGRWPMFSATRDLTAKARAVLGGGGGQGVVGIGPLGEGKSLGLRQAALALSREVSGWTVFWREPGAPAITADWLAEVHREYGRVLLCIDDADLVVSDLVSTASEWAVPGSGVAFLLASNDRLWWARGQALRGHVDDVLFHGVTDDEAAEICAAWHHAGLVTVPNGVTGEEVVRGLTQSLVSSLHSMPYGQHSTLFGAVLDVRFGARLKDRVGDLIRKLSAIKVQPHSDVSVGDIFGGICVLQHSSDPQATRAGGASRSLIAAMVDLDGVYADGKILEALGREAAIMFAGDYVYSRHPAIAGAVVQHLREEGRMAWICKRVARAGARLYSGVNSLPNEDYRSAYLLTRQLDVMDESIQAGIGAVEGAPNLLEPRVTLLSRYRKYDPAHGEKVAVAYSGRLSLFHDYSKAVRPFLNEYAQVVGRNQQPQLALGLAALSLHDGAGHNLDVKRARYGLLAVLKFALQLRQQSPGLAGEIPELACRAVSWVLTPEEERHVMPYRPRLDMALVNDLNASAVLRRLGPLLSLHARSAVKQCRIQVTFEHSVSLNDLERLLK